MKPSADKLSRREQILQSLAQMLESLGVDPISGDQVAIAVTVGAWAQASHFGEGVIDADALAANLVGAIVKDPVQDRIALQEYLENVVRTRKSWGDLYASIREVI